MCIFHGVLVSTSPRLSAALKYAINNERPLEDVCKFGAASKIIVTPSLQGLKLRGSVVVFVGGGGWHAVV